MNWHRYSKANSFCTPILEDRASEQDPSYPQNKLDFWSGSGCHAEATDVSNLWTPIQSSICVKTLQPIYNLVRSKWPNNKKLSTSSNSPPLKTGFGLGSIHSHKSILQLGIAKRNPNSPNTIIQMTEKYLQLTWIFIRKHVFRIFQVSQLNFWVSINATILTRRQGYINNPND